jgi:hypoxanthine phosphoribosyltransferase
MGNLLTDSAAGYVPDADLIVTAEAVAAGLDHLAGDLQPLIARDDCILLGVAMGGLYPLMQLATRLHGDFLLDYCHATRYDGATVGQELRWIQAPRSEFAERTVIVIDDILDEGITLEAIRQRCTELGARQVYTAVLAIKDLPDAANRKRPDYSSGIHVPNRYVFGCGMDLHERWRHLDAIYALRDD